MGVWHSYIPLDTLRARKGLSASDITDDGMLMQKAVAATAQFDNSTAREFEPTLDTKYFDFTRSNYVDLVNYDMLTLTSIVDSYGQTINTQSYIPLGRHNRTTGPFYAIRINPLYSFITPPIVRERAIAVTGVWGYHDEYEKAWVDTLNSVQDAGGINASVTTITVTANTATSVNSYGFAPQLSIGHLIQIDTEWMRVIAKPSTTTLTVLRAQNGTTAAAHTQNSKIYTYSPMADVVDAVGRWTMWLFNQDSTSYGQVQFLNSGMKVPAGLPPDLKDFVGQYQNRSLF